MKKSLRVVMPAALIVSALGCSHNSKTTMTSLSPRRGVNLTADDIARSPGVPIEQLLASRVPGMTLTRAHDGRLVMLIRGQSTLSDGNEPLFVVDGTPLGSSANFSAVNRSDIASIIVLRDAASMSMYGLQGGGGVILIKTKGF
jgi:TonB-dependent SusC/RagA subfamily outer membrane receptor